MKMDLQTLCEMVKQAVPTAVATAVLEMNQVIVSFTNRPDVEVALLTPYLQKQVSKGLIIHDELDELLFSLRRIANH